METEQIIIEAIKNRKKVLLNYEGWGIRRVAPHAIYFSGGQLKKLDAFQFDGFSKTGDLPAWRQFFLDKISGSPEVTTENFEICEGYRSESEKYINYIYKIN
ncbi:MAG: hypothetical protein A2998_01190 [Candidatus Staskawiczbacteria bacterium RIFCSPLOWO2_01_FULL_37_25b]|uniref:WYL domain-containing protein n=2 Tax=Candidatus Staskawicziibacteriota TaxID=1817916 RepID=A0A1G2HS50_9BACT|nr:MAG: hypothetical protein A2812_02875 [Candidatus Staskawiczbacteria bacterium RIFCSPHIGHO2_01_FULL_36_16]OGZ72383.1 MAG: hypothetical protein A2998_01190 [Candidatus Staskawiczbacteria bacterium RIFCSPLOWO2_01_FULL_37_25b]